MKSPDHAALFGIASSQSGYFTAEQARCAGFSARLLQHHGRTGRFVRIHRGLYRLRDYPSSPREEVAAAWLAVGKDSAVVSHDSALDLLGLSDVIPGAIHLSVPRTRRHFPALTGVVVHTTTRQLRPQDVTIREGTRVTSALRTIVDTAESGTGPEQVTAAIQQSVARGMVTPRQLIEAAAARPRRVARLVDAALARVLA